MRAKGMVREGEIATLNVLKEIQGAVPLYRRVRQMARRLILRATTRENRPSGDQTPGKASG
jgi:hypothetical protein